MRRKLVGQADIVIIQQDAIRLGTEQAVVLLEQVLQQLTIVTGAQNADNLAPDVLDRRADIEEPARTIHNIHLGSVGNAGPGRHQKIVFLAFDVSLTCLGR